MKLLLMVRPAKISHGGAVAPWLVGCLTMYRAGINGRNAPSRFNLQKLGYKL